MHRIGRTGAPAARARRSSSLRRGSSLLRDRARDAGEDGADRIASSRKSTGVARPPSRIRSPKRCRILGLGAISASSSPISTSMRRTRRTLRPPCNDASQRGPAPASTCGSAHARRDGQIERDRGAPRALISPGRSASVNASARRVRREKSSLNWNCSASQSAGRRRQARRHRRCDRQRGGARQPLYRSRPDQDDHTTANWQRVCPTSCSACRRRSGCAIRRSVCSVADASLAASARPFKAKGGE